MASHVLVGVVGGVGHERSSNRSLIGEHAREDAFEGVGGALIPACMRGEIRYLWILLARTWVRYLRSLNADVWLRILLLVWQ